VDVVRCSSRLLHLVSDTFQGRLVAIISQDTVLSLLGELDYDANSQSSPQLQLGSFPAALATQNGDQLLISLTFVYGEDRRYLACTAPVPIRTVRDKRGLRSGQ
jgi:hypothetical protein